MGTDSYALPEPANWRFDEIAEKFPQRAALLEAARGPEALLKAISDALKNAIAENTVRYGWEHAGSNEQDCRAVIQFSVGSDLFDWFSNARNGYRAHFRGHPYLGLTFNDRIMRELRNVVDACTPSTVSGANLYHPFKSRGLIDIKKEELIASLETDLSKAWYCTKRITCDGNVECVALQIAYGGPRIGLNDGNTWAAPFPDDTYAWLDVKGAFLGANGAYQIKCPRDRAMVLHTTGGA